MKKLIFLSFLFLTALLQQAVAQDRTVSGRVTDRENNQGLPGVTVLVKGTTVGASTNSDGTYSLSVPASATTLQFSFVGYRNVERAIGNSTTIDIALEVDTKQLNEVVVTALGLTQAKDEQGTATTRVGGEAVVQSGETSVITGLSGKSSGLQITRSTGDPGAGAYIQIRGQSTITGTLQPLIIVDGVPISNSSFISGTGATNTAGVAQQSRLNDINPNDIASVQILKGAAAAALWGSRAANGVMVITTKKGNSESGKLSVTYGATYSADRISYTHDLQDTYGRGSGGVAALGASTNANSYGDKISTRTGGADEVNTTGASFVAADGTVYYPITKKNSRETYLDKNFNSIFQTGHFLENSLSLSAGNKDANIYVSLSDLNQEGIIRYGSDYRRTTGRINAERRFNNVFRIAANGSYSRVVANRIQQGSNVSGLYLGYLRQAPDFDQEDYIGTYIDATGVYPNRQRSYRRQTGNNPNPIYNNPLWTIQQQKNPNEVDRFIGSTEIGLDPLPWLNFTARVGADTYSDFRRDLFPINSAENGGLGAATEELITETQLNGDFFAKATHSFSNLLSGTVLVGMNLNQRQSKNVGATYRNFILDVRDLSFFSNASRENTAAFDSETKRRNSAGYATLNLAFADQLFLNASGRLENASTFGREAKSRFFYPSADLAWQFSRLPFLADNQFLSFAKARVAYGQVGLEPQVYVTRDIFFGASNVESFGPTLDPGAYDGSFARSNLRGNPNLRPERKQETEAGLDLRFLQDRISLSGTYYYNKVTDAILQVPVASSTGYTNEWANAAELENRGVEIDLNADVIKTDKFTWNVGGNWTRNRNKVLDLRGAESIFLAGFAGTSSRAVKDQPIGVLWGGRYDRNDAGDIVLDANGFPQTAATEGVIGDPNPKWRSGLNTTLSYKGFRLFGLLETSFGGDIWAGTEGILRTFGTSKFTDSEVSLSAADAANTVTYAYDTELKRNLKVNEVYEANADGSFTFRGRIQDFGGGPVALDQSWWQSQGGGFGTLSEQFIQDATWTRIRELTLGYSLTSEKFRSLTRLNNVEFTLTGRNLAIWSKEFKGVDPETNLTGVSNGRGLEYFNNPGTRSFLVGVRITY
ncbi:SusC/RagA family TonB-linked outer membrane protein [Hymenobacter lutimineralis]|uniref:SusC/RagA family TonB-linked outer membrane protein n=1 Tax=Hymenobacter lutimineralis TaxID=2606448 RepID=A0A5D6V076_9BACT|nr:SusC/RagA family TonB-linked outer membrane protein [Hymenobacter lutimineralis]TYZ08635.1 SusC/RagA family TonB-linked outer membrane protein [Hymenobacter lutimineralis]